MLNVIYVFTIISAKVGCVTRCFKWGLGGLKLGFSIPKNGSHAKVKEPSLLYYLPIAGGGIFVGFYGISTFVGYLMANPFLCKQSVLFKTIQFSMSTQFNFQKYFYFKLFKQLYVTI